MSTEQTEVIAALEKIIAILGIHGYWENEVRVLIEMLGAIKKSDGQM